MIGLEIAGRFCQISCDATLLVGETDATLFCTGCESSTRYLFSEWSINMIGDHNVLQVRGGIEHNILTLRSLEGMSSVRQIEQLVQVFHALIERLP